MIQVKVIFIDGYTVPFEFSVLVSVTLSDAMFIIVRRNREKYSCTISFTHKVNVQCRLSVKYTV